MFTSCRTLCALILLVSATIAEAADDVFGHVPFSLSMSAGQSFRRNAGNTAFEAYTPGTGTGIPGGVDKNVQFNDGGAFGGFGEWDKTNTRLRLTSTHIDGLSNSDILRLEDNTSTASRVRLVFSLLDSTTANQFAGSIGAAWTTATHGNVSSTVIIGADYQNNINPIARFSGQGNLNLGGNVTTDVSTTPNVGGVINVASGYQIAGGTGTGNGSFPQAQGGANFFQTSAYKLPTTIGTNTYVLTSNGTDAVWSAPSGGGGATPAPSDTYVQFNDGGAFGGDAAFTWNKTNDVLNVTSSNDNAGVYFPLILGRNRPTLGGVATTGTGVKIQAEDSTTDDVFIGSLNWSWVTATHNSNQSKLDFNLTNGGTSSAIEATLWNDGLFDVASGFSIQATAPSGDFLQGDGTKYKQSAYKLPTTIGTNTYVLTSNGTDAVWSAPSGGGGTPGGSNTQVQFNDSGAFGGDAGFTWDKTAKQLSISIDDAVTSSYDDLLTLTHTTTGTAANGMGVAFRWILESNTGVTVDVGRDLVAWNSASTGSVYHSFDLKGTSASSVVPRMRLFAVGSTGGSLTVGQSVPTDPGSGYINANTGFKVAQTAVFEGGTTNQVLTKNSNTNYDFGWTTGFPLGGNWTGHGDSDYTILSTDRVVYTNANFTALRTWTLPAANTLAAGTTISVIDLQATVTGTNRLKIQRAGADLIYPPNAALYEMANSSQGVMFYSDGSSKWYAVTIQPGNTSGGGTSGTFAQQSWTAGVWAASLYTLPTSIGTSGKILISNGTNVVFSAVTYPNNNTAAGKIIRGNGTNFVESTATYPDTAGTSGNVLTSDGTNWTSAAPTGGATAPLTLTLTDAGTGTAPDILILDHESSGTPAANFGDRIAFHAKDSTTAGALMGGISTQWTTATHGASLTNQLVFGTMYQNTERVVGIFSGAGGFRVGGNITSAPTTSGVIDATSGYQVNGAAASGNFLQGSGSIYGASAYTLPTSAGASGKIAKSDGTNLVMSTETYATPGASGNVLTSDGTNWTSSTPLSSGTISDTAYASSWNGVTTIAPSKNAVYDELHLFDTNDNGKVDVLDGASGVGQGLVAVNSSGGVVVGIQNRATGTSSSGTAGTNVATITAGGSNQLVGINGFASQVAAATSNLTVTVTYSDSTSTNLSTAVNTTNFIVIDDAGLILNGGGGLTANSAKKITSVAVTTAGAGTGARQAILSATEIPQ